MAKTEFNNDWQSLIAKPEVKKGKKFVDDEPDPFYQKREDTYYTLFPSQDGEKYAFAIVPAADGRPFVMEDIMTIKRHRFTSPKDGKHYFENLKLPMDPKVLFDMSVLEKVTKDPNSITEEDKATINNIKKHSEIVQRYKDLQYCKDEGVNFGYAKVMGLHNSRLQKQQLTGFFGVWTKWKGAPNDKREFNIKFISSRYGAFQDKFRSLLQGVAETHQELQPSWYEDYFSHIGGVKGVIDVEMASMAVGGKGATVKLVKLGKDPIDDKGVGVTGPITEKDIKLPKGDENVLSHLHFFMGFKSNESLWQEAYVERFEAALAQLEAHVANMKLKHLGSAPATDATPSTDAPAAEQKPAEGGAEPGTKKPF